MNEENKIFEELKENKVLIDTMDTARWMLLNPIDDPINEERRQIFYSNAKYGAANTECKDCGGYFLLLQPDEYSNDYNQCLECGTYEEWDWDYGYSNNSYKGFGAVQIVLKDKSKFEHYAFWRPLHHSHMEVLIEEIKRIPDIDLEHSFISHRVMLDCELTFELGKKPEKEFYDELFGFKSYQESYQESCLEIPTATDADMSDMIPF